MLQADSGRWRSPLQAGSYHPAGQGPEMAEPLGRQKRWNSEECASAPRKVLMLPSRTRERYRLPADCLTIALRPVLAMAHWKRQSSRELSAHAALPRFWAPLTLAYQSSSQHGYDR